MILPLLMAAHVAGALLWVGGLFAGATLMIRRRREKDGSALLRRLEGDCLFKASHPGMLIALLSGAGLVAFNSSYFLQEGWLYAKLALVLVLVAVTVLVTSARKREDGASLKALAFQRGLLAAGALGILLLVFLKPF